jgi:hypothetical protein
MCDICGAHVPPGSGLEEHLESLKPVPPLDLECRMCGEKFIEHRALRQVCAVRTLATATRIAALLANPFHPYLALTCGLLWAEMKGYAWCKELYRQQSPYPVLCST